MLIFFCGANSMGSNLLKHYIPSWETLWSEDCVNQLRPWDLLEGCLSRGLQSCRKRLATCGPGSGVSGCGSSLPSQVQVILRQPPIRSTVDVSSAVTMAITLATSSAEGSNWGWIWVPHFWILPEALGLFKGEQGRGGFAARVALESLTAFLLCSALTVGIYAV